MAKAIGVIPARYGSSRFPGKPLVEIRGKSMIARVYEQARKARLLDRVVVATDDQRIADHVVAFGGEVVLTSPLHLSGTDRCAEAVRLLDTDHGVVINIQGDEPLIAPEQIDRVAALFMDTQCLIGSLVKRIEDPHDLTSDTVIKVVKDVNNNALYFSRNIIPHLKGNQKDPLATMAFFKHIGIYGYRSKTLFQLTALPFSALEKAESLEQLRWLENGYRINLAETDHESNSVDTPEDLTRMLRQMKH